MQLYELKKIKTRYQNMRGNIVSIINILSSSSLNDELTNARKSLEENYLLNDNSVKSRNIVSVKNSIDTDISKLRNLLNSIDLKLKKINKAITDLELSGNM